MFIDYGSLEEYNWFYCSSIYICNKLKSKYMRFIRLSWICKYIKEFIRLACICIWVENHACISANIIIKGDFLDRLTGTDVGGAAKTLSTQECQRIQIPLGVRKCKCFNKRGQGWSPIHGQVLEVPWSLLRLAVASSHLEAAAEAEQSLNIQASFLLLPLPVIRLQAYLIHLQSGLSFPPQFVGSVSTNSVHPPLTVHPQKCALLIFTSDSDQHGKTDHQLDMHSHWDRLLKDSTHRAAGLWNKLTCAKINFLFVHF